MTKSEGKYELCEGGFHSGPQVKATRRGISAAIKPEVVTLLMTGIGPQKLRTLLQVRYRYDDDKLALIPTVTQIANLKSYMKPRVAGG